MRVVKAGHGVRRERVARSRLGAWGVVEGGGLGRGDRRDGRGRLCPGMLA
jgi:hypothetical protein